MLRNKFTSEIVVSIILIILLVLFLNPFSFWMPTQLMYVMIAGLVVLFAIYTSFIWRETPQDEREQLHRLLAGRISYLAGSIAIVIVIIIQSVVSSVDPWLVIILAVMVLAKIVGLMYGRKRQ